MKTLQGIVQDKDPVVELVSGGTETEREREREREILVISSNEAISKLS